VASALIGSLTAGAKPVSSGAASAADPAVVSVYPVPQPHGLMATSGGWAYCLQVQALARNAHYTLVCGRYAKDGYLGYGLRSQRRLDWGDPGYLASFARKLAVLHSRVGGPLLLIGVSYSGFGVATLASHEPALRPARLIVIDSYLDLVGRRASLPPSHQTAREIDAATGGSIQALRSRSVSVPGLARLVRGGTDLTVIWSTSADEQREFAGATCDRNANAATLQRLSDQLGTPVSGWVTHNRHGHDLWDHGREIVSGQEPGLRVEFAPGKPIPAAAVCG
jgi:pimeloyl-ACP methyl ester carboxylesterase